MKEYPLIITDMQQYLASKGKILTNKQVYKLLVKSNLINSDCSPTQWAMEQGFISVNYSFPEGLHPETKENSQDADINTNNGKMTDHDVDAVLSKMPTDAFVETDKGLSIRKQDLRKAISESIKRKQLSQAGAKSWSKVLQSLKKGGE
ncbi:MAG: hypothetical protein LKG31_01735 [Lactobacillus sp.]|jgi:hypothetical protein|nr:hypothetical protein [Lactobacillus sp.]